MILQIKLLIAKWLCGIVPYKCINDRWYHLPFGVSRVFWPWKRHSVEPYELDAIKKYGTHGGVFLDIGANAGLLTLAMRDWAGPAARIYAVEPNPHTYELLSKVMVLNRVNPVGLWAIAIADRCGTVKFQVSRRDPLGVMSSMKSNDPDGFEIEVPCMTLDTLCQHWDRLDYIKVDVEGAEVLVLTGARATLTRLRPVVQVEVHGLFLGAFGHTVAELFSFMDECGYVAINAVTSSETTSDAFMADTGLDVNHPITGKSMRHSGYGHLLFRPINE